MKSRWVGKTANSPPSRREKESTSKATRGETCYFQFCDPMTVLEGLRDEFWGQTCMACSVQSNRLLSTPPPTTLLSKAELSTPSSILNPPSQNLPQIPHAAFVGGLLPPPPSATECVRFSHRVSQPGVSVRPNLSRLSNGLAIGILAHHRPPVTRPHRDQ